MWRRRCRAAQCALVARFTLTTTMPISRTISFRYGRDGSVAFRLRLARWLSKRSFAMQSEATSIFPGFTLNELKEAQRELFSPAQLEDMANRDVLRLSAKKLKRLRKPVSLLIQQWVRGDETTVTVEAASRNSLQALSADVWLRSRIPWLGGFITLQGPRIAQGEFDALVNGLLSLTSNAPS
jgi:hypothetical protein